MAVLSTVTYATAYDTILQDRLDRPTTWKELVNVEFSETSVISSSYMSTVPSVTTVTRGTGLVLTGFAETAETFTINNGRDLGLYLDLADEAQSPWTSPAELFDVIGALLNEFIETFWLANHSTWTDFGTEGLSNTAGATQITVSASNIDDIILGIRREIREANGQLFMKEYGVGFAWGPNEFQFLEMFAASNGFSTADQALKEGLEEGIHYLGHTVAQSKPTLIVSEVQRWITRAKEIISTLNDLTRGGLILGHAKV